MKFKYKGYAGKYLRVDLSSGKIKAEELNPELAENYLGGEGFGIKILWDEVPPSVDPLSPENKIIFATGPLNGSFWPNAGRLEAVSKSPLTGIYGDSNCGGFFAPELKYAGFDYIVIEGKAEKPVYLYIKDGRAELRNAGRLWGKYTLETERLICDELNDSEIKTACIGPAGENLVRFACIVVTPNRTLARCGLGAVMGSKNLKAVAVRGCGGVEAADLDGFRNLSLEMHQRLRNNPIYPAVSRYGTPGIVTLMNTIGRFPTRNFQQGSFEDVDLISAETLHDNFFIKDTSCFACPIACDKIYEIKKGKAAGLRVSSFEYETLNSIGAGIGSGNLEDIIIGNDLCDQLGMDSISAGRAISFAIELFEKGILKTKDTGGTELKWGDSKQMLNLLSQIAYRRGFGDLLAGGVRRAAQTIGKGAGYYAMHVKGQEISAQDGRAQQSMGLTHATSTRGADHLKGFPTIDETGYTDEAQRRFGDKYLPEMAQPQAIKYKPFLVKDGQDFGAVVDSAITCKSGGTFVMAEIYWDEMAAAIRMISGMDTDSGRLKLTGERIYNLMRCYNVLHGISRKDDTLPERLLKEPSPSGAAKGYVCRLDEMLPEYYNLRDWDGKTGYPTRRKLEALDIKDAADAIEKKGREAESVKRKAKSD